MRKANMMIHKGGNIVDREVVRRAYTPGETRGKDLVKFQREISHQPISHIFCLEQTESFLENAGYQIIKEEHALAIQDEKNPELFNRYFGLLQLRHQDSNNENFDLVVGVRNSHDKKFPWGLVIGASVFICDNLSFIGEVKVMRKHTANILKDLEGKIAMAIAQLSQLRNHQNNRIEAYQQFQLSNMEFNNFVINSLKVGAITSTQIPKVLNEWDNKDHTQFQERNLWRAFNHVTEVSKGVNIFDYPIRSTKLHGLCDAMTNMNTRDVLEAKFQLIN
jgi:hypothetical protein